MSLDIRIPIGLLFGIIGVLLVVYGLTFTKPEDLVRSLTYNVNVWWGAVLAVFGLAMLGLAWLASRARKNPGQKQ